jgi:hypothetical protein
MTLGRVIFLYRKDEGRQLYNYLRAYQHFKKCEGLLPYSQEPSTSPYPEPDQSSPYRPILLPHDTTAYVLVFFVAPFLLAFLPISYKHSFPCPFVLLALPISFFLT